MPEDLKKEALAGWTSRSFSLFSKRARDKRSSSRNLWPILIRSW